MLDGFRRGDQAALDLVYRTYAEEVAGILVHGFLFPSGNGVKRFRGLDSRFDLEDLLQEVFTRAFSEPARLGYDGLRPYGAYLAAIARTVVIDRLRSESRWQRRFESNDAAVAAAPLPPDGGNASDPLEGTVAPGGNPAIDFENAELARLLQEIQSGLSADEAEVFRLRFREGLSLAETERATGRSPSKVKTLERKLRVRVLQRIWGAGYLAKKNTFGWLARLQSPSEGKNRA